MIAALHGELTEPHGEADAYSLFVSRSSAMGWLTETAGGLWGMNDAHITRFQVGLTEPIPDGRPLPVQPFLTCVGDVVARLGPASLRAVQVLLPLQALGRPGDSSAKTRAVAPLLQDACWFADCVPDQPVRVTADGGQDGTVTAAASRIHKWMRQFEQNVFSGFSLTENHVSLRAPVADDIWGGPSRHRITFSGTLAEWSLDALGWLAAYVAEACVSQGVHTPVILTAQR